MYACIKLWGCMLVGNCGELVWPVLLPKISIRNGDRYGGPVIWSAYCQAAHESLALNYYSSNKYCPVNNNTYMSGRTIKPIYDFDCTMFRPFWYIFLTIPYYFMYYLVFNQLHCVGAVNVLIANFLFKLHVANNVAEHWSSFGIRFSHI